jgi:hypothetical protein
LSPSKGYGEGRWLDMRDDTEQKPLPQDRDDRDERPAKLPAPASIMA